MCIYMYGIYPPSSEKCNKNKSKTQFLSRWFFRNSTSFYISTAVPFVPEFSSPCSVLKWI